MRELDYLSKEYVKISELMNYRAYADFASLKEENNWQDCVVSCIESGGSWNYYKINLNRGRLITIDKRSNCQIRKVEKGLFKGCYCVIEASDSSDAFTILYVFDNKILLKYPKFKEYMTEKQVDLLLDQKQIEVITAKLLNQFDISKRHQEYEFFCENLPNSCWKKAGFVRNVLDLFEAEKDVDLKTDVDKRFVKLEMCKDVARNYFKELSKKKTEEKML